MSEIASRGRFLTGVVTSNKMDKTAVVKVMRRVKHPLYEKIVTKTSKLHVHDPENQCQEGDTVVVKESRPFSKTKCWQLVERIESKG